LDVTARPEVASTDVEYGLTAAEVAQRVADGRTNDVPVRASRSVWEIVRANVFTRINAIFGVLFLIIVSTGYLLDGMFGLLILANSLVGMIQELRAKKTLDRLSIIGQARPRVRRDGRAQELAPNEIVADTVVAGIGARPVVDLAVAAGLDLDDGVAVDSALRTSDPDIFAAGDIASIDHPLIEGRVRVEHWSNALDSGPAAARSMLGQDVSYDRLPYFFTDQYDLGMEYIGYAPPGIYDTVTLRGDVDGRVFQAFWLRDGQARAGMHVNMWDDGIAPIEELVRSGRTVDPDRLSDPEVPLDQV
jgi:3-phenylpropionate/trans-cinnamate dioxygenase ferredoxin reductase component